MIVFILGAISKSFCFVLPHGGEGGGLVGGNGTEGTHCLNTCKNDKFYSQKRM